jgi:SAM-dependent methyltransferase
MSGRKDFYAERHARDSDYLYAAASYNLDRLTSTAGFRAWAKRQGERPVRILDVGAGRGQFLLDLSLLFERRGLVVESIVGLDLIESTPNVFGQLRDFGFVSHNVDGEALPFEDAAFDLVSCNHVIEHVFETEALVREIRRVMDDRGIAIISAPNVAAWMNRIAFLFGGQPLGSEVGTETTTYGFWPGFLKKRLERFSPSGHIRDFTPGSLRDLTAACGFRAIGWWPQSGGRLSRVNPRLDRDLGILLVAAEPLS